MCIFAYFLKIIFLLLNSVHILTENQGGGGLTSVWDGNVSQWVDSEYCEMIGEKNMFIC